MAAWCDFETITDPEKLFVDPTYLVAVVDGKKPDVGSDQDDEGGRRFRCLVLEDADNYLHARPVAGRPPLAVCSTRPTAWSATTGCWFCSP